jgi:hypothetical protein
VKKECQPYAAVLLQQQHHLPLLMQQLPLLLMAM